MSGGIFVERVSSYIVPLAFVMHGLGMIGGVYFVATGRPLIASTIGSGSLLMAARLVTSALWVVSGAAFVAAAWGVWTDAEWWRTAAWVAAPTSVVGIALWAGAVPPGTYVGAGMALAVIVALFMGW